MPSSDPSRLKSLKRRPREVWQGGLVRLPLWVTPRGREPFRPWAGVWISLASGKAHIGEGVAPSEKDAAQAFDAFLKFATDGQFAGYLPERIEVTGAGVAPLLAPLLADLDVAVSERERLAGVDDLLGGLARKTGHGQEPPGILDGPGVTLTHVASFAEAARLFHLAAPWKHLTDEDLIRIEEPQDLAGLRHAVVLGAAGREFGLTLFEERSFHEALLGGGETAKVLDRGVYYVVFFGGPEEMPLEDSALFEDHRLAVAGPKAYPWAAQIDPGRRVRRLNAKSLARIEAVLRALAATTGAELDSGRWTRIVGASGGPLKVTLALADPPGEHPRSDATRDPLPDRRAMERVLVEMQRHLARNAPASVVDAERMIRERFGTTPIEEIVSTAVTPLERAQDLCYRAFSERGRRKAAMARGALEVSPECADAYVILAEQCGDPEEAMRLYAEGVAAGELALGPERFAAVDAPFWADVSTRPFMRALRGLAARSAALGRRQEAIACYQRLIRLNPEDNQGVRWLLAGLLLEAGDDAATEALLGQFEEDVSPQMLYARALWLFRREGDTAASRGAVHRAVEQNPHVVDLLLGIEPLPPPSPHGFVMGSVEEAADCVEALGDAWEAAPGALAWLEAIADRGARPRDGRGAVLSGRDDAPEAPQRP